jgi:hypothetical protein
MIRETVRYANGGTCQLKKVYLRPEVLNPDGNICTYISDKMFGETRRMVTAIVSLMKRGTPC